MNDVVVLHWCSVSILEWLGWLQGILAPRCNSVFPLAIVVLNKKSRDFILCYHPFVWALLLLHDVMTLRSNSGCNTQVKTQGWMESRGRKGMIQLVKRKEYRRVSTVYIPMYHEEWMRNTCGRHEVCWVKNMPHQWGADWAIRYMKWYETKKWSMWLHHGKHLYEIRLIITGYQLICLIS